MESIVSKFPGRGSAGDRLQALIDKALKESSGPGLSYKDDIEPWLGDEAAFFVTGKNMNDNALLIAAEDEDKAREALEKSAEGKITRKSYRDVDYFMDEADDTNTAAVFDGFVVTRHGGRREGRDRHEQGRLAAGRLGRVRLRDRRRLRRQARAPLRQLAPAAQGQHERGGGRPGQLQGGLRDSPRSSRSTPTRTAWRSRARCRRATAEHAPVPGPGERADQGAARRLMARHGAAGLRQDARLLHRVRRGLCRRARRGRAAVQGGHRARPPEGRARLDGRLRRVRARDQRGRAQRRAHHRDERRGRVRAPHRAPEEARGDRRPTTPATASSRCRRRAAARASRS